MSIYKTAYDTTACRGAIITKIQENLTQALIRGLLVFDETTRTYQVRGGHLVDELVPTFNHPILFKDASGVDHLAVDVRGLGSFNRDQNTFVIRDSNAYNGVTLRANLNEVWLTPMGPERIRSMSVFPLMVYANWVGEAVAKRLALDPQDQFSVSVLAAILYLNMFWDVEKSTNPTKIEKSLMVSQITRGLSYKADLVYDIVEQFPGIATIAEFCQACRDLTQSARLRDLNEATLFAMTGGYWYGNNGREVIAVALEHPPTWLSLLWQAMSDRSYRNSGLAKILERTSYKRAGNMFGIQVASLATS